MASSDAPQAVLAEQLAEVISGRKVRAAVFTTFSFDPGFFELHVLPMLFDIPFSQVEKVKRIQLDDALQKVEQIAVYYDRTALAQDALPAQLDIARIGVRGPHGVFHPKLVLVLVENQVEGDDDEGDPQIRGTESLIIGCLSANLTRAGWWENLEVGHFETIDDRDQSDAPCPFRKDLIDLTRRIRDIGGPVEEQPALERIRSFLLQRTSTSQVSYNSAGGKHHTRLFFGQSNLPAWLEEVRLSYDGWNLEVISPYFDGKNAGTLERLVESLQPRETRIYLPQDRDGAALATRELYDAVGACTHTKWSTLPGSLTRPGARASTKDVAPRFVHAKIYRLWNSDGKQVVLLGSVNLTAAAHSHVGAGNLEAGFLVDVSDDGIPKRWWLQPLDAEPSKFSEHDPLEDAEAEDVFIDLSFSFDWRTSQLRYRVDEGGGGDVSICDPSGKLLFEIHLAAGGRWVDCGEAASAAVRELLPSTSFLQIKHAQRSWRVLVREDGMLSRPSLLATLTPEEILMYWSLLSDAQRESFILEKLSTDGELQGLTVRTNRYAAQDTIFDRFAGIYHAFEQLYRHVTGCIERGELRDAEARMFGAKYDSLPELLRKTLEENKDPVMRYIMFLCAKQICERVRKYDGGFWSGHRSDRKRLDDLLAHLPQLAQALPLDDAQRGEFLEWYESMFVRMIQQPEIEA